MFESYFNQVKDILASKDGKDIKLEKIQLLTGLVDGMKPATPRYNLPTQQVTPVTSVPVSPQGDINTGPRQVNGRPINANGNDVMALKRAASNAVRAGKDAR